MFRNTVLIKEISFKNNVNSKIFLLLIFCSLQPYFLYCQTTSNRLKFRYHISDRKLKELNSNNYFIEDGQSNKYTLCPYRGHFLFFKKKPFKLLVTNSGGELSIDPWSIKDKFENDTHSDPCFGSTTQINSATPNTLKITSLKRNLVGDDTKYITLHYQTVIVGINVIGLKVRPEVKNYNDSSYSANVITGNLNLGLSVGYSFGWSKFTHRSTNSLSLTPGFSLGFSSSKLSTEPLTQNVSTTYIPGNLILSPSATITVARNDIGIILAYGKDYMVGTYADKWAYQGKGFFGLGIAAGLKL